MVLHDHMKSRRVSDHPLFMKKTNFVRHRHHSRQGDHHASLKQLKQLERAINRCQHSSLPLTAMPSYLLHNEFRLKHSPSNGNEKNGTSSGCPTSSVSSPLDEALALSLTTRRSLKQPRRNAFVFRFCLDEDDVSSESTAGSASSLHDSTFEQVAESRNASENSASTSFFVDESLNVIRNLSGMNLAESTALSKG
mmetsp:Transcript_11314/g.18205  ORF Transcript_11314/g.18205 Transcript_11314/m.18205 type:complete len:195 (+) Transcript_11314:131-715(+)|eukprot:CAMPEP_0178751672 /NCGR_PEP_ID=MMETSP0744-20121128/10650_1 /TAXON_ID=913974 /ORGANISM="Nitzschia punctata, Strain CCMP561" /LENGTH=194 /DNA_ID=CAMNT_0020405331 /DNA_START=74 /DNA_END=658 /DNA_ORIENTATION=+